VIVTDVTNVASIVTTVVAIVVILITNGVLDVAIRRRGRSIQSKTTMTTHSMT